MGRALFILGCAAVALIIGIATDSAGLIIGGCLVALSAGLIALQASRA